MKFSHIFLAVTLFCSGSYALGDNNNLAPIDSKTFVDDSGNSVRNYMGGALASALGLAAARGGEFRDINEGLILANAYWPAAYALDWLGFHVPNTSWIAPAGIALATAVAYGAEQGNLPARTIKVGRYSKVLSANMQKWAALGVLTLIGIW